MASSFFFGWYKKKRKNEISRLLWDEPPVIVKISYKELFEATDGFSSTNLIGVGSFGSVYKGIVGGEIVAIKVLNNQRQGASKSFMAECEALGIIRHRYLVRLITACSTTDFQGKGFKALIYKFMPGGNLGRWLHSRTESNGLALNLHRRINIAIEVARALQYLHHYCSKTIIHCDLKPSNILLDEHMVAHVGDLGLAKFLPELPDLNQRNSIRTRGTTGYAAPEYGLGSEVSRKGDIYSYGILLLEMMTGKKPTDPMFEDGLDHHSFAKVALPGIVLLEVLTGKRPILDDDDILDLHSFARKALPDRVMEIVDPLLLKDLKNDLAAECLISMVRIGVACSMKSPQDRMDIKKVIDELNLVRDILQGTRKRPTRRRPTLDLRMSWLVSLEKSNRQEESSLPNFENSCCQEESESYSQGEPCLPIFENSYSQEESESCSQEESESYSQGEPCPPIFENSYCQEESESYSQGEPCLPIFENSFNQEESWLPNFENSFSQEESWLPNFEKSYIYSGRQESSFLTQKMFSNFVPLLPKPAPLLPWEGPSWISFEESYRREEPKSDIHGKPWIPKFEKSLSEKES